MATDLRYIFNIPIEIDGIGKLYSFTMSEYINHKNLIDILSVTLNSILQTIDIKDTEKREYVENNVKIFDILTSEDFLLEPLCELLYHSFHAKEVLWCPQENHIRVDGKIIDRNNFDYIREQIIKSNNLKFAKQAKNKELQEWFDKENKLNNSKNNSEMEDVITSIMAFTGYSPNELLNFTIYQINSLIARLNKINEYKSNIQLICAGVENIKLEHWSSHIEDKDDNSAIPFDKFMNNMGSTINNK